MVSTATRAIPGWTETGDADGAEWTWFDAGTGVWCSLVWANDASLSSFTLSLHMAPAGGLWDCMATELGPKWWHAGTRLSARAAAVNWIVSAYRRTERGQGR